MAPAGQPASYVGTVRGSPAGGTPGAHTLHVAVQTPGSCRLALKMLSLTDKARWQLHRLAFVTDAPEAAPDAGAGDSTKRVRA